MNFNSIVAASVAALALTGSAVAADLPGRAAPPVIVAPAPIFTWTGFYAGANIGWYGSRQGATDVAYPAPGFGAPAIVGAGYAGFGQTPTTRSLGNDGLTGGVHAGFNYQFSSIVLGLEGDFQLFNRRAKGPAVSYWTFPAVPAASLTNVVTANNNWLASVRGRLGFAYDRLLVYATGGVAWTNTSYSAYSTALIPIGPAYPMNGVLFSQAKTGYVVGGGLEWAFAPNWSVRAEYMHYEFGGANAVNPIIAGSCVGQCGWATNVTRLKIDTAKLGVSYRFGGWGGAPVVARY